MDRLAENIRNVKSRIDAAAQRSGRSAKAVTLVAVTKYVDSDTTAQLVSAGLTDLGESRPQVLWQKAKEVTNPEIRWHMIGHLQRNKVDKTVPLCQLIHSVDSIRLLSAIDAAAKKQGSSANCLLEVNISGESAKHGFEVHELEAALTEAANMSHVRIQGFMGMASLAGDLNANQKEFAKLRQTRDRFANFQTDRIRLSELSMGMSRDFEQAIEEGSTIVRIGSILFEGV